ncbi:MAG: diaminopimelate epimerase [Elusimicrobia bacterium]|nr:diaminopimelate epimerase [Elusimicrobiota bacterium]
MKIRFVKMSGAGNDFVLVDAAELKGARGGRPRLARAICDRRASVGADGLLIVGRGGPAGAASLEYYNADGSEAFCANGSRCAAWYIHRRRWAGRAFVFNSIEGPIRATITGDERVRIFMPQIRDVRLGLKVDACGKTWRVSYLNTGVPHVVVEAKDLDAFPVFEVGRALRRHRAFAPAGANVNFVSLGKGAPRLRTYERGVEDETLACGTGATATAAVLHLTKGARPPIRLQVKGGDTLTVGFRSLAGGFEDVWLEGPAKVTFTGETTL